MYWLRTTQSCIGWLSRKIAPNFQNSINVQFRNSTDDLPTVLLGLRTTYKKDTQASLIEILFESTIRIPGGFFYTLDSMLDP